MKVIKRSGKEVDFDIEKIVQAVNNVFNENGKEHADARAVAEEAVNKVESETPHVEEIQDMVEKALINLGHVNEARSYIRYREKHAQKRKEWIKAELPLSIWTRKYQYKGGSFEEFFDRISKNNEAIRKLIKEKAFIPAGRILANRGLQKDGIKVTYSNCYVTAPPKDNLESINEATYRLERTFSYGGGSGIDISKLRPRGAKVNNAAKTTSGAVSFLDKFDISSKIIGQKGRRAALMASIDVSHPDVIEFIEKKLDLDAVNKANMSIRVTDEFLKAALNNESFKLKFEVEDTGEIIEKTVNAQKILNKLAYGNWYSGEPGCLFWDRIENHTLLSEYGEFKFAGTNPCGF